MLLRKHLPKAFALLVLLSMVLAACGPAAVETVVVTEKGEEVIVTATPEVECDNRFLGSCKLDGNGIPPDFFMDEHVRKAFNYCFDWDIYIRDVLAGEAIQNVGYLIPGMVGYEPDGAVYAFDLEKCAEEMALAWDGAVAENGFRMQIAYNSGNDTRRSVAEILQANLSEVDERYLVEIVALPWPAFLENYRNSRIPMNISGWIEDLHDPHNWAQPFLVGTYARRQKLPEELFNQLKELVGEAVGGATNEERAEVYHQLNQIDYEQAIGIRMAIPTGRTYLQKWVEGYYYNPIYELRSHWARLSKSEDAPDPTTFTYVTHGDVDTLDPAWNYENFGDGMILNVYNQLVTYDGPDARSFIPMLAESWEISPDGTTYTFKIKEGVKFHEGQDLTVEDVEYTFERAILQGGTWSPQWLFTEPLFGTGVYDVAELVDPEGTLDDDPDALKASDPAELMAACEAVTSVIESDAAAGTVTFQLSQPWGPFLATLAQSWGSIIDEDWAIENGTWDGDCATWQDYYGIDSATAPLREVMNGTGPYKLDHWTPLEEIVIVANEDYWGGAPALKRVIVKEVDEWGTRFAMLKTGDADYVTVDRQYIDQVDPFVSDWCAYDMAEGVHVCEAVEGAEDQPLRLYMGHPQVTRTDTFFTWNIAH